MLRRHDLVRLSSYVYTIPYQATYQVVKGRKVAHMVSNWPFWINTNYHAWKFDLSQLDAASVVDFRLTSEAGEWHGRIPRSDLPAKFVSFNCTGEGFLKMRGRYFSYFRKVA